MATETKNLSSLTRREIAKKCLRAAMKKLEKADFVLFGQDPEQVIFPKIHTANAYTAMALEALEEHDPIAFAQ